MEFDFTQIRELLTLLSQTDISELSLKSGDFELTVRKDQVGDRPASSVTLGGAEGLTLTPLPSAPVSPSPTPPPPATVSPPTPSPLANEKLQEITSPMVGTFYRSPAPDEPPFVDVGDRIRSGQTVCIIEAMKLMNELEAEVAGEVVELIAQNGEPVEYGQVLMRIKPV